MKKIALAALAALSFAFAACTSITPVQATGAGGNKVGEAGPTLTLFAPATGGVIPVYNIPVSGIPLLTADVSLQTAAENGGITTISTVDTKVKQILFLYWTSTIVTGE